MLPISPYITLILPLVSAINCLAWGRKLWGKGDLLTISSFVLATMLAGFYAVEIWWQGKVITHSFSWIEIGGVHLQGGIYWDKLSSLLSVLVLFAASLVAIFSRSYLKEDPYLHRYWGYLSLFCFAMLLLLAAPNLWFLFIGWELVGLCSYLLIGFWFEKEKTGAASQKAFLMNRIGDIGFLGGILWLFALTGKVAWTDFSASMLTNEPVFTAIGLLLFCGAIGKSAQFPLQTWLPDAMEGPTPVSSLIHAATMVAAGVYLLARIFPLLTPTALLVVAIVGALTALIAAFSALRQWDIKRVLAYSTISQLGYMVMGMGVGAYDASIFHLITHAFFKCGLFLVSAIIIHEMKHQAEAQNLEIDSQDLRNMGGLRKAMPYTFFAYLALTFALMGLPFFSGFLSKEAILLGAMQWAEAQGVWFAYFLPATAFFTAGLTAFYMTRHAYLIFFGESRLSDEAEFHETDKQMWLPVAVLALLSTFLFFSLNPFSAQDAWIMQAFALPTKKSEKFHLLTLGASLFALLAGVLFYLFSQKILHIQNGKIQPREDHSEQKARQEEDFQAASFWVKLSENHFYWDKFYTWIAEHILKACYLLAVLDKKVLDGFVNLVGYGFAGKKTMQLADRLEHRVDAIVNEVGDDLLSHKGLAHIVEDFEHKVIDNIIHGISAFFVSTGRYAPSISTISAWLDMRVIDGAVNGLASSFSQVGKGVRSTQGGRVQRYVFFALFLGALIAGLFIVLL